MKELALSSFQNQFVVSREAPRGFEENIRVGEWFVGYDKRYKETKIFDAQGVQTGSYLGAVVDPNARAFRPQSLSTPWDWSSEEGTIRLEEWLYEQTGSWIAIVSTPKMQAIYLDACGSLPLVYSPEKKSAGSSASALLGPVEYFNDLYDEAKSETWFRADWYPTAGLTAHRSLRRLLPNHRLRLDTWEAERIWPHFPFPTLPVNQVIDAVGHSARETIAASMRGGRALVPLTAGNETRALLSLVRDRKEKVFFFTGSFPGAAIDLGVARRLAKRFRLAHVITSVEARSANDVDIWRRRTGHCVGGAIGLFRMDRKNIPEVEIEFSGAAGEVGRAFLWSAADKANDRLTSDVLLARLKLPKMERFVTAVDRWLEAVRPFDAFTVMDLAYIELKMACWAGPQATGAETDVVQIWPISSRRSFAAMMSAPPEVRLEQSLFRKIVEREWPDLLEIPINQGTALESARNFLYRASSPRRVWNKLRKNFSKMRPTGRTA